MDPDPKHRLQPRWPIDALAAIGGLLWLFLNGLLWYARPPDVQWFVGSLILGVVGFAGFLWYAMHE
jgi:hypothetical protein